MADLRPLKCEFGVLERADGSARVCQGATSVLAAVYGPAEVKASKEKWDRATVEVVVKPARGQGGVRERWIEKLLTGCCETCIITTLHPHTAISITLQIYTDHGSLLSTMCIALCLGLVDAGLQMPSLFSSLITAITQDGDIITDPTLSQEKTSQCMVTMVTDCVSGDVITTQTQGVCTVEQLEYCLVHADKAGQSLHKFYQQAIHRRLSKDAKFSHLNIAI